MESLLFLILWNVINPSAILNGTCNCQDTGIEEEEEDDDSQFSTIHGCTNYRLSFRIIRLFAHEI